MSQQRAHIAAQADDGLAEAGGGFILTSPNNFLNILNYGRGVRSCEACETGESKGKLGPARVTLVELIPIDQW